MGIGKAMPLEWGENRESNAPQTVMSQSPKFKCNNSCRVQNMYILHVYINGCCCWFDTLLDLSSYRSIRPDELQHTQFLARWEIFFSASLRMSSMGKHCPRLCLYPAAALIHIRCLINTGNYRVGRSERLIYTQCIVSLQREQCSSWSVGIRV